MPRIYLDAPPEGKGQILRALVSRIVMFEDGLELVGREPYSILMRPTILGIRKEMEEKVQKRNAVLPR